MKTFRIKHYFRLIIYLMAAAIMHLIVNRHQFNYNEHLQVPQFDISRADKKISQDNNKIENK